VYAVSEKEAEVLAEITSEIALVTRDSKQCQTKGSTLLFADACSEHCAQVNEKLTCHALLQSAEARCQSAMQHQLWPLYSAGILEHLESHS
jgi:glycosyltransferase A (GT-A) superfamily protein (DUF2064 family)